MRELDGDVAVHREQSGGPVEGDHDAEVQKLQSATVEVNVVVGAGEGEINGNSFDSDDDSAMKELQKEEVNDENARAVAEFFSFENGEKQDDDKSAAKNTESDCKAEPDGVDDCWVGRLDHWGAVVWHDGGVRS